MSILLDIFGSVIIAGMLFMLIIKLDLFSSQTSYASDSELKLIQNTKTLAEIIDYDFRKVGYRVSGNAIEIAEEKKFKFKADINFDNNPNTIEYTVSTSEKVKGTENPDDIILYRIVDSDTSGGPSLGLVNIKFSYLDSALTIISSPVSPTDINKIRYIKTEMWVQGVDKINDAFSDNSAYSKTYWEFTINPRNL